MMQLHLADDYDPMTTDEEGTNEDVNTIGSMGVEINMTKTKLTTISETR